MKQYQDLLRRILKEGETHHNRTGVPTKSLFGETLHFDLNDGDTFPLVTTRFVSYRLILGELLWFLSGSSDIADLQKQGIHIWNANYESQEWKSSPFYEPGSVGKNYGVQWRNWTSDYTPLDQIAELERELRTNPLSRRHLVTAWNPAQLDETALPPCHVMFQLKVHHDDRLSMLVLIRSSDAALGLPFNIASYATLLLMFSRVTTRKAHRLTLFLGDVHIYETHIHSIEEQLSRVPNPLPRLTLPTKKSVLDYMQEDFALENYTPHKALPMKMVL